MDAKTDLQKKVFSLTREYGMSSVMLRNAVSRKLGLNITDMECLSLLSVKGLSSPTELARYTGMTTGAATTMLDRLEIAGFITRKPNPNDRRGVVVEVNAQSTKKMGTVFAGAQAGQRSVIESYSPGELRIIVDFLEHITQSVSAQADVLSKNE
ncbi:MAG: MarR family winged helix-turn-helix transcriptional regulator [Candidatus Saccharibacteria bacterium]